MAAPKQSIENRKQFALLRLIKATTTLPAQVTLYATTLGALASLYGTPMPPALAAIATTVGVNTLANMLERVAKGDSVKGEEMLRQVLDTIEESNISDKLRDRDIQIMVAKLFRKLDVLTFAVKNEEYEIVNRLTGQFETYEALALELRVDVSNLLSKVRELATRAQADEIIEQLEMLSKKLTKETKKVPVFLAPTKASYSLIGREMLMVQIKQLVLAKGYVALFGQPGVGKSALAAELAYDITILNHFEDGVLWTGLGRKCDVLALLAKWAEAMGLTPDQIAKSINTQKRADAIKALSAAIHDAIGTRKILLVIDDAWDAKVALTFKVGGPNCCHLLTTRVPSVAVTFANPNILRIDELDFEAGLNLLEELIPTGIGKWKDEAKRLIEAVGGLPLALILLGNYLRTQILISDSQDIREILKKLLEREIRLHLSQPQAPLDLHPDLPLEAPLSLFSVIGVSDGALDHEEQKLFYALSAFPPKPNSFDEQAALAISDNAQKSKLNKLIELGLLDWADNNRYTLHQTIADYAEEKLADPNVFVRMVDYYVRLTEAHNDDLTFLDLDYHNIVSALDFAFKRNMHSRLISGANAFYKYLETRGFYEEAETILKRSQRAGKLMMTASFLNLGNVLFRRASYAQAKSQYNQALKLSQDIGEVEIASDSLRGLGNIMIRQGKYSNAEEQYRKGLELVRSIGREDKISMFLKNLGAAAYLRGSLNEAANHYKESLELAHKVGLARGEIVGLMMNLGVLEDERGNIEQARDYYEQGLQMASEIGDQQRISGLLLNLGVIYHTQGDYSRAEDYFLKARNLAQDMGLKGRICEALEALGSIAKFRGEFQESENYFREGLKLAHEIGQRENICSFLMHLGRLGSKQGNFEQANLQLKESLKIARTIANKTLISDVLGGLGILAYRSGEEQRAEEYLIDALKIAQEIGHSELEGDLSQELGLLAIRKGEYEEAEKLFEEALGIAQKMNYRILRCDILNKLGELRIRQGKIKLAYEAFSEAQEVGANLGFKEIVAIATYGLARTRIIEGDMNEARQLGERAFSFFERNDHYLGVEVKSWLENISSQTKR
jgi:tetratricopeptide (TPR) repeat protein